MAGDEGGIQTLELPRSLHQEHTLGSKVRAFLCGTP
jgi:hypothetical protein